MLHPHLIITCDIIFGLMLYSRAHAAVSGLLLKSAGGVFVFADSCRTGAYVLKDVFILDVTQDVLFLDSPAWGLLSGEMKCNRRPVGTRGLEAKFWSRWWDISKSAIFRVQCSPSFDLMCWLADTKTDVKFRASKNTWEMIFCLSVSLLKFPYEEGQETGFHFLRYVMDLTLWLLTSSGILRQSPRQALCPIQCSWGWPGCHLQNPSCSESLLPFKVSKSFY